MPFLNILVMVAVCVAAAGGRLMGERKEFAGLRDDQPRSPRTRLTPVPFH
jgi:hypothetical protein